MKLINTKWHALNDYACGLLLIASPFLFDFYDKGKQTLLPVSIGALVIIYSAFTKYENSLFKAISIKSNLMLDMIFGGLLAVSPWLFRFNEIVYAPHLIIGSIMILVSLLSDNVKSTGRLNQLARMSRSNTMQSTAWLGHTE
jgi:hypothetical protein